MKRLLDRQLPFFPVPSEAARPWKPGTRWGFTLLEILIALFIFGLVASAIFTAYTGTLRVIDETESRARIDEMAGIALERICEDLASSYLPNQAPGIASAGDGPPLSLFEGEKMEIQGRSFGSLRFLSLAHVQFSGEKPVPEPVEIVYHVTLGGDNLLQLYRSDTPGGRVKPDPEKGGTLLCDGLSSISFTYYDSDGEPHESWDAAEGDSRGRLPTRVSIYLEFVDPADPDRPCRFMTGVKLSMGG